MYPPWTCTTSFGVAVVPLVARMKTGSVAATSAYAPLVLAPAATKSSQSSSPAPAGAASGSRRCTTTCSTSWSPAASVASTMCLSGTTLPRRRVESATKTAFEPDRRMRWPSAPSPKPANTTLWMAPMRAHASISAIASTLTGIEIVMRSPCSMPSARSAPATRSTSASSSAYDNRRSAPSSRSQIRAGRSPKPASTWRSRHAAVRFVVAPLNHVNVGTSHSSTLSHGENQGRLAASRAQKASGSASASRCSRWSSVSLMARS